jgi:hypothetical protein
MSGRRGPFGTALPLPLAAGLIAAAVLSVLGCAGVRKAAGEAAGPSRDEATDASGAVARANPDVNGLPDVAGGTVYGEFEDQKLYESSLKANADMVAWSGKEIFDGYTGATIQAKTYGRPVSDRVVLIDGKIAAYADGFGQFWIRLAPGAYTLVGRCRGYRDYSVEIDVPPGSVQYVNFYLRKK